MSESLRYVLNSWIVLVFGMEIHFGGRQVNLHKHLQTPLVSDSLIIVNQNSVTVITPPKVIWRTAIKILNTS